MSPFSSLAWAIRSREWSVLVAGVADFEVDFPQAEAFRFRIVKLRLVHVHSARRRSDSAAAKSSTHDKK
jgi:hypothetical protein